MGAGPSTPSLVSASQFLKRYVSEQAISSDDPMMMEFSTVSWDCHISEGINAIEPSILNEFKRNNLRTHNLSSLMKFIISRGTELIVNHADQSTLHDTSLLSAVQNAILVFKISAVCLLDGTTEQNFYSHLGTDSTDASSVMECFLQVLLNLIVKIVIVNETYPLHCEVITTLIILLARQMYQTVSSPLPLVFCCLMCGKCASLAPAVVARLLRNFAEDLPPPPGFLGRPAQPSIVWRAARSLVGGLWTVVTLGYLSVPQSNTHSKSISKESMKSSIGPPMDDLLTSDSPTSVCPDECRTLANLSTLLLLVLTAQASYTAKWYNFRPESDQNFQPPPLNPYRIALFSLKCADRKIDVFPNSITESDRVTELRPSTATLRGVVSVDNPDCAAYPIDFSAVRDTAARMLQKDSTTLLLYLLLHRNPHFGSFLLDNKNYNKLLLPLLNILYRSRADSSHLVYMALIILLILTEHPRFAEEIHTTAISWVKWSSNRQLSSISYGSLVLLVLFRTIRLHLDHLKDKYLYVNLLASLANLSARVTNMHPYVSDSLLNLLQLLAKKYNRTVEHVRKLSQSEPCSDNTLPFCNYGSSQNVSDRSPEEPIMQELSLLEEVIRMLLEILNSILTHVLCHNTNLIYSLLYKRDCLDSLRLHSSFQSVVHNLDTILSFFSTKIEQELGENPTSPTAIIALINKHSPNIQRHCSLKKFPNLKFKYVEEESPDDFFIPYVWSIVLRQSGISFRLSALGLFNSSFGNPDGESSSPNGHQEETNLDSPTTPSSGHDVET